MDNSLRFGLSEDHLRQISTMLATNRRIEQAFLFGSRAKGTHRPGSDIDIALKGSRLTLDDILSLSIVYDDLWLPYKLDLLIYDRINNPELLDHIDRFGKPLL